jgi:YesN/AraC family two-component response regulator
MIKAMIVDDETLIRTMIRMKIDKEKLDIEVVGEFGDSASALEGASTLKPDIIISDICMPGEDGISFSEKCREILPGCRVIIVTGYNDFEYARRSIRAGVFDYLMKPATEQELGQIMTRYYENKLAGIPQAAQHANQHLPIILVVNAKNEHLTMQLGDIAFFRYNQDRKLWEVVCADNSCYVLRHRTTADVILNYSEDFVQIHKRYIVNINHIKMIQDNTCILSEPLEENRELRISKNYRAGLMAVFYSL